jgi:hypothetical protein
VTVTDYFTQIYISSWWQTIVKCVLYASHTRKTQKTASSQDLPLSWIILLRCSRHRVFKALFFGGPILCGNTTLVSTTVLCMICKRLHIHLWDIQKQTPSDYSTLSFRVVQCKETGEIGRQEDRGGMRMSSGSSSTSSSCTCK